MSRPLLSIAAPSLRRGVVHHARPPRMPAVHSPYTPPAQRPSAGTSTAQPTALLDGDVPPATTASVSLEGTRLTLHHAPPPSAPSYTTGTRPDLLRWVSGEAVPSSAEAVARMRRTPRATPSNAPATFSDDTVARMRSLRAEGKSRSAIAKALDVPPEQAHLIARVAPASKAQRADATAEAERQKESWSPRKRLARDVRARRKAFW